ncbi:hypothetical protein [Novosphingobium sp. JCM 18896]|uniref:hypothetical protein n=1 Tax=Novosphingobium sp. JCM 18896 TaxID=2989731 RepID=UPI002221FECC|nr:hypothetical protein [Novosphingobium sp. JCM 18896]MCW1431419.1 hypothetical protein [Novosphingobium sp. JCM 18896]
MIFSVEPFDHWRPGDRAYCLHGLHKDDQQIVEAGKIYAVVEAQQFPGMMNDGLKLAGIEPRFWSGRFVCLRGRPPYAKQLAERTRRGWYEAYRLCSDARNATARKEGE